METSQSAKTAKIHRKNNGKSAKGQRKQTEPVEHQRNDRKKKSAFAGFAVSRILGRGLMLILFRRIETIADVAHGADEMLVLATQLGAQTTDMHV